jgi:hypothetical protein
MRKIAGVKAVRVTLNDGLTVLDLDAGNAVTLAQLRTVLKNNGFVSREARIEAAGTVAASGGGLTFSISGTGETFPLLPGVNARTVFDDLKKQAESGPVAVQLKGTASVPDKKGPPLVLDSFNYLDGGRLSR